MEHLLIEPDEALPALAQAFERDFHAALSALLTFLPDVRLKREADALAEAALAVPVAGAEGLRAADAALAPLRAKLRDIDERFEYPCRTAHELHRRLTRLRAEFKARGDEALSVVGRRILDEQRRLRHAAEAAARRAQEEADRLAREAAQRAAAEAAQHGAPEPIVQILAQQAATAAAPPVPPVAAPALASSAVVSKWRARLAGTPPGGDPNPATADLDEAQRASLLVLLRAIVDGQAPLSLVEVNWSVANKRAAAERGTMRIPGLEAYDEGSVRAKRR